MNVMGSSKTGLKFQQKRRCASLVSCFVLETAEYDTCNMKTIFLILISLNALVADSHFLQYRFTRISYDRFGLPEFSVVGYVDDKKFISYDTNSRLVHHTTQWMDRNEGQKEDPVIQVAIKMEPFYRHDVKKLISRLNQTGGFHIFQQMFRCELKDDGSTSWNIQYGYDGRNFMFLDTQSGLYIPEMNAAEVNTQTWNHPDIRKGERDKNYLQHECLGLLKMYIEGGREDLEKRVCPEVKVWGINQPNGLQKLNCLVYGFHPGAVRVKWVKNEIDHVPTDEMSPILPHPDGTYQIKVSVKVPKSEEDTYSCHVDHSSLEQILIVKWDPRNDLKDMDIIFIVICIVIIAAAIAVGIFMYKKNKCDPIVAEPVPLQQIQTPPATQIYNLALCEEHHKSDCQ